MMFMKKYFRLNLTGVDGTFVCGMASSGMCDGFFLEQQMMTYSAVAGGVRTHTRHTDDTRPKRYIHDVEMWIIFIFWRA